MGNLIRIETELQDEYWVGVVCSPDNPLMYACWMDTETDAYAECAAWLTRQLTQHTRQLRL